MPDSGRLPDYYKVLGVGKSASQRTIRKAYRRLAKKYHPDVTELDSEFAEERFISICRAYKVLKTPRARAEYDTRMGFDRPESRTRPGEPFPFEKGYTQVWDERAQRYRRIYHDLGEDTRWVESPYSFMERRRRERREAEMRPGFFTRLAIRFWRGLVKAGRYLGARVNRKSLRKVAGAINKRLPRRTKKPPHKIKVARRGPPTS
jgi:DnaJ-class molecular chaperone